jgi:membrane associated rhomboid family serine protease
MIRSNFANAVDLGDTSDILTSMYIHTGVLHLVGNMVHLWIFGDNVKDRLGPVKYLVYFLFGGVIASLTHAFIYTTS